MSCAAGAVAGAGSFSSASRSWISVISVVSISSSRYVGQMLDVEHEHVTSLRPGEHFYQLVVPCAGMALIIAGPNGWACFGTRILIAAALQ